MTIAQLISLATNRLAALNNARATAVALGHIDRLDALDADIAETQTTLDALRAIPAA
jgi:hypothetical protein